MLRLFFIKLQNLLFVVLSVVGVQPYSFRNISNLLAMGGWSLTSKLIPSFFNVPKWMIHMQGNKL